MPTVNTDEVYKQLKKQNGEEFARVIRGAALLGIPNIVHVLEFAGRNPQDAQQLVPIIWEIYKEHPKVLHPSDKSPLELLGEAGYDAFVVKTEEQKNSIKKYYRRGEEICTLRDPHRHEEYYMIHAIKRDAGKILPSDNPQREDEYGTSVISIQILKTGGFISIKNRYNHTVLDPDNTFNSNPDNIILGLSDSLKKFFHVDFNTTNAEMPYGFRMVNGQLVRYYCEVNNMYFGPDYYFSGSTITRINTNNQILFYLGFVLNLAKGNSYVESLAKQDEDFCNELNNRMRGKKVTVTVNKDNKIKTILLDGKRFMDLDGSAITYINMPDADTLFFDTSMFELVGDVDFSGVRHLEISQNCAGIKNIKLNPKADVISLGWDLKLSGDYDFSHVKHLTLGGDLSDVKRIKLNPHADLISLYSGIKLSGELDFSHVKNLKLLYADLTKVTKIKLNPNAENINFEGTKFAGDLDFSDIKQEDFLRGADLTRVSSLRLPDDYGDFSDTKLAGHWDFSKLDRLTLNGANLTKLKSVKFSPTREQVCMERAILAGNVDLAQMGFGNLRGIMLSEAHLGDIKTIKFPPYAKRIELDNARLAGDLDFTDVKFVRFFGASMTNVKSIRLNRDLYEKVKNQEVVMNRIRIPFSELKKRGIKIIMPSIFETAKNKVIEKLQKNTSGKAKNNKTNER